MTIHLIRHHSTRAGAAMRTRPPSGSPSGVAGLGRARDLIESALGEDLTLERLAGEAGVAAHSFAAAFTRAFGVPPYRYVIQRRVERAKSLLRHTDLPISRIAYDTGFSSQSHLSTTFKRAVGVTPGQYRRP
jgi:AraC family transcriptional regulator